MEKQMKLNTSNICSICYNEFKGYGNNAEPLKSTNCCDACNIYVIIARMKNQKTKDLNTSNNIK